MKRQGISDRHIAQVINGPDRVYQDDGCRVAEGRLQGSMRLKVAYTEAATVPYGLSARISSVEKTEAEKPTRDG